MIGRVVAWRSRYGPFRLVTVSQGGHGTARLDQVRFGGLAASCGGRVSVRFVLVSRGRAVRVGFGLIRLGPVCFGNAV